MVVLKRINEMSAASDSVQLVRLFNKNHEDFYKKYKDSTPPISPRVSELLIEAILEDVQNGKFLDYKDIQKDIIYKMYHQLKKSDQTRLRSIVDSLQISTEKKVDVCVAPLYDDLMRELNKKFEIDLVEGVDLGHGNFDISEIKIENTAGLSSELSLKDTKELKSSDIVGIGNFAMWINRPTGGGAWKYKVVVKNGKATYFVRERGHFMSSADYFKKFPEVEVACPEFFRTKAEFKKLLSSSIYQKLRKFDEEINGWINNMKGVRIY